MTVKFEQCVCKRRALEQLPTLTVTVLFAAYF